MRHPNLFSLDEGVIDQATNGKFTLASLVYDKRHEDKGPKTEMDKVARHFITHGEIPESYRQKMERRDPNHKSEEGEEHIKEEAKMPFFKLNEACNCGAKSCPECNGKKDKEKKAVKEDAFDKSIFKLGEECACGKDNCNCGQGVSTGVAKADGLLNKVPVNQFQKSDSNFVGDGEDTETSKVNVPSILAAKTAGGDPDPKTVHNGINKQEAGTDVFKVQPVGDVEKA